MIAHRLRTSRSVRSDFSTNYAEPRHLLSEANSRQVAEEEEEEEKDLQRRRLRTDISFIQTVVIRDRNEHKRFEVHQVRAPAIPLSPLGKYSFVSAPTKPPSQLRRQCCQQTACIRRHLQLTHNPHAVHPVIAAASFSRTHLCAMSQQHVMASRPDERSAPQGQMQSRSCLRVPSQWD